MTDNKKGAFLGGALAGTGLGLVLSKLLKPAEALTPPPPEAPLEEKLKYLASLQAKNLEMTNAFLEVMAKMPIIFSLPAPLTPEDLIAAHQAVYPKELGVWKFVPVQESFKVSAGTSFTYISAVKPGWVLVQLIPMRLVSDYYSEDIRYGLRINERWITRPLPVGESLKAPLEFPGSIFTPLFPEDRIITTIVNKSAVDATLTVTVFSNQIELSQAQKYYLPWLSYPIERLRKLVEEGII